MTLLSELRSAPSRRHLITAAYHTPNGDLHLGHLGGPFLCADVLARHLKLLGHQVASVTATDAHEAYVLLAATVNAVSPRAIAERYYASAVRTLAGFDMEQDRMIDGSAEPWEAYYQHHSHQVVHQMLDRLRIEARTVRLPWSRRTSRYVMGPFALGRCPACDAEASGTSCERCGLWFGPGDLRDLHSRLPDDVDLEWRDVDLNFLRAGPDFCVDEVRRRFGGDYVKLFEQYVDFNGAGIYVSHPLGWGVPWQHQASDNVVHVSYGIGSYAATMAIARAYIDLTPGGSPFSRQGDVVTVLTAGHDAALPCMFLLAMSDADIDWQTFKHHVVNHFLLLNGEKFSTTRSHVITGPDYLAAGLPSDAFRWFTSRIFPEEADSDFRTNEFREVSNNILHDRLGRLVDTCLVAATAATPATFTGSIAEVARRILAGQVLALALPRPSIRLAASAFEKWISIGEQGMAAQSPYWWLKTAAVIGYPFAPRWSQELWQCLGELGSPSLVQFERAGLVITEHCPRIPLLVSSTIDALLPPRYSQPTEIELGRHRDDN